MKIQKTKIMVKLLLPKFNFFKFFFYKINKENKKKKKIHQQLSHFFYLTFSIYTKG